MKKIVFFIFFLTSLNLLSQEFDGVYKTISLVVTDDRGNIESEKPVTYYAVIDDKTIKFFKSRLFEELVLKLDFVLDPNTVDYKRYPNLSYRNKIVFQKPSDQSNVYSLIIMSITDIVKDEFSMTYKMIKQEGFHKTNHL